MSALRQPEGRAFAPAHKRAIVERLLACWLRCPSLRLGQMIDNAVATAGKNGGVFYIEDEALAKACEDLTARGEEWTL